MKDSWCFNIISILISLKSSTSFHSVACFSLQILFELYFKSFQVVLPPTHQTSIKHPSCCIASIKSHKEYSNWPVLSDVTDLSFCVGFAVNVAAVQVVNWDHPARPNVWQKLHPQPGEDFGHVETSISWVGGVALIMRSTASNKFCLKWEIRKNAINSCLREALPLIVDLWYLLFFKKKSDLSLLLPRAHLLSSIDKKNPKRLRRLWWCNGRPFLGPWPLARSWGPEVC